MTDAECNRVAKIAQEHDCTLECGDDGQGGRLYVVSDDHGVFDPIGFQDLSEAERMRKTPTFRRSTGDD